MCGVCFVLNMRQRRTLLWKLCHFCVCWIVFRFILIGSRRISNSCVVLNRFIFYLMMWFLSSKLDLYPFSFSFLQKKKDFATWLFFSYVLNVDVSREKNCLLCYKTVCCSRLEIHLIEFRAKSERWIWIWIWIHCVCMWWWYNKKTNDNYSITMVCGSVLMDKIYKVNKIWRHDHDDDEKNN